MENAFACVHVVTASLTRTRIAIGVKIYGVHHQYLVTIMRIFFHRIIVPKVSNLATMVTAMVLVGTIHDQTATRLFALFFVDQQAGVVLVKEPSQGLQLQELQWLLLSVSLDSLQHAQLQVLEVLVQVQRAPILLRLYSPSTHSTPPLQNSPTHSLLHNDFFVFLVFLSTPNMRVTSTLNFVVVCCLKDSQIKTNTLSSVLFPSSTPSNSVLSYTHTRL